MTRQKRWERILAQAKKPVGVNDTVHDLKTLKPGESMVYYAGDLATDRVKNPEVDMIAEHAFQMAAADPSELHLVQIPQGKGFAYLAIAAGRG